MKVKRMDEKGVARVTTVLFDDQYEFLHNGVNIRLFMPITGDEYFACGSTALLDAVRKTILDVGNRLNQSREEDRPGKVIFIITTDGHENVSREFNWHTIRDMIRHQREKYSWEFIFWGANIDADETAEEMGIPKSRSANFNSDENGMNTMFNCMESYVSDNRENDISCDVKEAMEEAEFKCRER